jgi:hypothetical protein
MLPWAMSGSDVGSTEVLIDVCSNIDYQGARTC